MDRLRFRYCDDGARAVVNVLAWKPMGIAPGLSELGESAALRAIARDALDAWRLAAARTAAAVAGPSAGIGEDAAFDAAVCCGVAEAFAACFGDAGGFARHAEAALLAAEAIESGRAVDCGIAEDEAFRSQARWKRRPGLAAPGLAPLPSCGRLLARTSMPAEPPRSARRRS